MNTRHPAGALQVRIEQSLPMPLHGSFSCAQGELLALVGPSGAGKTSILRCLAGLMRPQKGRVTVGDTVWVDTEHNICLPPQQRHVGLVFQNYALMPHLSALDNVALSLLHLPPSQRRERAAHWLGHMHLSPEQQSRRPNHLSGGQQQRVAVARALAREPHLLLLDEPFSAVDQMNRQGLYDLLAELRETLGIPMVLVTHDLVEARHLADKLVVMDGGTLLQEGAPAHIYRSPRNARVADLVGIQNRFKGRWLGPQSTQDQADQAGWLQWFDGTGQASNVSLRVRDKGRIALGQEVSWVIQGDGLHTLAQEFVAPPSDSHRIRLPAQVVQVRHLGETTLALLAPHDLQQVEVRLVRSGPERQRIQAGQTLRLELDCDWVHVMPTRQA